MIFEQNIIFENHILQIGIATKIVNTIGIDKKETNEDIILEYEKTKGIEKLHEIKYIVL